MNMINFNDIPADIKSLIFSFNRNEALNKKYKRDMNSVISTLNKINKMNDFNAEYIYMRILDDFNENYEEIMQEIQDDFYINFNYYDTYLNDTFQLNNTFDNDDDFYDNYRALNLILNNFMMRMNEEIV